MASALNFLVYSYLGQSGLDIIISLRIASKTNSGKTLQALIANAEKALSNAKAVGRNKAVSFWIKLR